MVPASEKKFQQSLSLPALNTNSQFHPQIRSSRLRKAGRTSATPKNMSGSDVDPKQAGQSAQRNARLRTTFQADMTPTCGVKKRFPHNGVLKLSSDLWDNPLAKTQLFVIVQLTRACTLVDLALDKPSRASHHGLHERAMIGRLATGRCTPRHSETSSKL